MDWDDLRIFLAVARNESLSGAGRVLRIDPATVGRRVARLEDAIGAGLFAKTPQGYALTESGTRLLAHAERTEAAVDGAAFALTGAEGLTGQIRIGAPDGCANYLLPQVLARICDANPGLEVQIVALPRVFNLSKREADMAIAVSRIEATMDRRSKFAHDQVNLDAATEMHHVEQSFRLCCRASGVSVHIEVGTKLLDQLANVVDHERHNDVDVAGHTRCCVMCQRKGARQHERQALGSQARTDAFEYVEFGGHCI